MTIKKVLFGAVESAVLVEESLDTTVGADEVAGSTLYTLVSAGTELNIYLGNYVKRGLTWGLERSR